MVLNTWDVYHQKNWYWISVGALLCFTALFNILFTLALTYLNRKFSCCITRFTKSKNNRLLIMYL